MPEPTPEPWRWDNEHTVKEVHKWPMVVYAGKTWVGSMYVNSYADARLVLAVPDLLAAAKAMVAAENPSDACGCDRCRAVRSLAAAIRKAEGEPSHPEPRTDR